ncbi:MAG: phosphoserine phosphatase SerB [Nitrosopumilus sp.]|nr:phosphoserine phosphatase SerB [Nitrosopumilus sp.]CAI9831483.1 Phosphoserine phosphatase SerB [Nitrosopumilaceae archaeon]MDA7940767.1 phosphoserine phosphatase SerB [Nitrosopumilus sp.]MDA7942975.1 phosphoserine phosphatase SerB [Nitrosopumilus sp.]MDA7944614.1 phosphoserine phosphatase SerB [Nitrosopumilus sp.]
MLVIFDVEGVLYDEEYLPILAEEVGRQDEIWEITRRGISGAIDWEEGLRTRVEALRGLDEATCRRVADSLPIMTGAREACRALKAAGWRLMAVSGGFTIMMDRLQRELGLDRVLSNELVFRDGRLDGVRVAVGADKAAAARGPAGEWGEKKEDTVCVVDGANDVKLFGMCGLGIAYRAQDVVKEMATEVLETKDLAMIVGIINRHYGLEIAVPRPG